MHGITSLKIFGFKASFLRDLRQHDLTDLVLDCGSQTSGVIALAANS